MLCDNLEECFNECQAETFVHIGAPAHTSKLNSGWMTVLQCELYPRLVKQQSWLKLLWKRVEKKDTSLVPKLKGSLLSMWEYLKPNFFHSIEDSFPQILHAIIKKKGCNAKH